MNRIASAPNLRLTAAKGELAYTLLLIQEERLDTLTEEAAKHLYNNLHPYLFVYGLDDYAEELLRLQDLTKYVDEDSGLAVIEENLILLLDALNEIPLY